jgi:hypothetical protein
MNKDVLAAYEKLVLADQLVIDAMIVALYKKDCEISRMAVHIMESSDEPKKPEGM